MRTAAVLLCLACAGCGLDVFGPDEPEYRFFNLRPLDPVPSWYATEYAAVEACVGMQGNFAAVRWMVADSISRDGELLSGLWLPPHEIVLPGYVVFPEPNEPAERVIVRHESEHHIRQQGNEIHLPNGQTPCERDAN